MLCTCGTGCPIPSTASVPSEWKSVRSIFELVREGLVNAIIHRDYAISGAKCQFVVSDDTIKVMSPGAPVEPITLDQMQAFNAPMLIAIRCCTTSFPACIWRRREDWGSRWSGLRLTRTADDLPHALQPSPTRVSAIGHSARPCVSPMLLPGTNPGRGHGGRRQSRSQLQEPHRRVPAPGAGVLRARRGAGARRRGELRPGAAGAVEGPSRRPLPGSRHAAPRGVGRRSPRCGRVRAGGGVRLADVLGAPAGALLPRPLGHARHRPRRAGGDLPARCRPRARVPRAGHRTPLVPDVRIRGVQARGDARRFLAGQRQRGRPGQPAEHAQPPGAPDRGLRGSRARPAGLGARPPQAGEVPRVHRHLRESHRE